MTLPRKPRAYSEDGSMTVETARRNAYNPLVSKRHETRNAPPQAWVDALKESRANLSAGRMVDGETVHQMIRDSLARMEARRRAAE